MTAATGMGWKYLVKGLKFTGQCLELVFHFLAYLTRETSQPILSPKCSQRMMSNLQELFYTVLPARANLPRSYTYSDQLYTRWRCKDGRQISGVGVLG